MPRNPDKTDYSGNFPIHFAAFESLEDPRSATGWTRHHFGEVLFICVTGVLCGMNGFAEIEHFAKLQRSWFEKWISLPHGIPRAQTLSNLFQLIDPTKFQQCLIDHVSQLHPDLKKQIIAIDGKALRGSHEHLKGAHHAVSAWAEDTGITLAQVFVDEKSNEITAIPKLLEMLDLQGHIVTMDAMGTQVEIAKQIVDQGGDYVLALKGNQGSTHDEVIDHFDFALRQLDLKQAKGWSHHQSETETSHGRITQRAVLSTTYLKVLDPEIRGRWKGLKSLIVVEVESEVISTKKKRQRERRYYLSSLDVEAVRFEEIIRKHWSIENQCHWVLDVTFREDANRTRRKNAPKNFSTLLRMALNILKTDQTRKGSLPFKRREAALDLNYRESILFSQT